MTLPADFSADVDSATNAIYSAWPQFCQCARDGFAIKQRGTFLIDLDQPITPDDAPYLTTAEASAALGIEGPDVAILSRVGTYNPNSEIVVTFKSLERNHAQCVVLGDPPAKHKKIPIVADHPDPNKATNFDELLDILNDIYFRSDDVEGMDLVSQHVWRIMEAKWQIESNGFGGYFWNTGTECSELPEALNAVQSTVLQKAFSAAFAMFPNGAPSTDDDEFDAQLSKITESKSDAFGQCDSDFYEIEEQLPTILWSYWQDHRRNTT